VKTNPKRSYSVIENERFGLVFAKTGSIISGTGDLISSIMVQYNVSGQVQHRLVDLEVVRSISACAVFMAKRKIIVYRSCFCLTLSGSLERPI
jgi:hypothetical protein